MSILLSGYYPEGIVFAADKNATIIYEPGRQHVEPTATKVLGWPFRKAVVGFVGLGRLASLTMDEWMRLFITETRGFDDIDELAHSLRDRIQEDFDREHPASADLGDKHLVIHLGGFAARDGIQTPVLYHIWNHGAIHPERGCYPPAERTFGVSEDIERDFGTELGSSSYPAGVRAWLRGKVDQGEYQWYNNGANLAAFNTFKNAIWQSLRALQGAGFAPGSSGLDHRIAFCKMAVEVFGSFFTHYFPPDERAVGGGVDAVYIHWPE